MFSSSFRSIEAAGSIQIPPEVRIVWFFFKNAQEELVIFCQSQATAIISWQCRSIRWWGCRCTLVQVNVVSPILPLPYTSSYHILLQSYQALEKLRFTCTANGKSQFVPRYHIFPSPVVNCSLYLQKSSFFMSSSSVEFIWYIFYLCIS